ncbi:MAG TPA: hypothetical protein DCQ06_12375 [Myxococcales bacterium]|nr:hypothetical protein [Myxococcales bacterium]HAN32382.1 hypothetical protein [Myxococcales bacterium]
MKTIFQLATVCGLAFALVACGSDDSNTAATNTVTDSGATAFDAGGSADSGAVGADTGSAAADTGSGAADTGSGAADTGSTPSTNNCQPNDNQCIATCGQSQCGAEIGACSTDAGCAGLLQCLSGCQSGVQPPDPASDAKLPNGNSPVTCTEKCYANAGPVSTNKQQEIVLCSIGKCVKEIPGQTVKCPQSSTDCLNSCMAIKCLEPFKACNGDPKCNELLSCLNKCPTGDQNCQQGCALSAGQTAVTNLTNVQSCLQNFCIAM